MADQCDYGCATLPDHEQILCNDYRPGGISSAALLECDHTITDYSDETQWNANIASGKVKLINGISGEVPEATPAMVDNPIGGGAAQIVLGMDNKTTFADANVNANNDDFYAKANLRKMILALFNPINDEVRISAEPVVITAIPVMIPKGDRTMQAYKLTADFFTKAGVIPLELHSAPSGIFV